MELQRGRAGQPLLTATSAIFLAPFLLDAGSAQRARHVVLSGAGGPELPFPERKGRATVLELLARSELTLGNIEAAERWAREAAEMKGLGELPIQSAPCRRARSALLLAQGDAAAAAKWAMAAADGASAGGIEIADTGRWRG